MLLILDRVFCVYHRRWCWMISHALNSDIDTFHTSHCKLVFQFPSHKCGCVGVCVCALPFFLKQSQSLSYCSLCFTDWHHLHYWNSVKFSKMLSNSVNFMRFDFRLQCKAWTLLSGSMVHNLTTMGESIKKNIKRNTPGIECIFTRKKYVSISNYYADAIKLHASND